MKNFIIRDISNKTILIFFLLFLFSCLPVQAMKFYQPTNIGYLVSKDGLGFYSENALPSSVENIFLDFAAKDSNVRLYITRRDGRFGSSDISNTIPLSLVGSANIYEISTDKENLTFYIILQKATDGLCVVDIVGKNSNKFIKYFGNESFKTINYNDNYTPLGSNSKISVSNDTIILSCSNYNQTKTWDYLITWDEATNFLNVKYKSY